MYRIRIKVLTDRRTNLIPIGHPPSGGALINKTYIVHRR